MAEIATTKSYFAADSDLGANKPRIFQPEGLALPQVVESSCPVGFPVQHFLETAACLPTVSALPLPEEDR